MRLSHVTVTMPPGNEDKARHFYGQLLGLPEIPNAAVLREGFLRSFYALQASQPCYGKLFAIIEIPSLRSGLRESQSVP